jgi:hypothetical protein
MKTYSHETYLRGMANLSEVEDNAYAWILAERDQLAAHVERLVGALECVPVDLIHAIENGDTGANVFLSAGSCKLIGDALAATPAQSLAAHDAALLREVADREFNPEQSAEERWAHGVLYGEADRREKEGA